MNSNRMFESTGNVVLGGIIIEEVPVTAAVEGGIEVLTDLLNVIGGGDIRLLTSKHSTPSIDRNV